MELTIRERLVLLQSLPREADMASLRIMRKLKEGLSFSELEHARYGLTHQQDENGSGWQWQAEFDETTATIEIGERAADIVVKAFKDLDKAHKLTEDHCSLWDKFIGDQ